MHTCRSPEHFRCIGYPGSTSQTWALTLYGIGYVHEIIYPQRNYHLAWENIKMTWHILLFTTTHVVDMAIRQGRGASEKQDCSRKQHLSFFLKVLEDLVEGELRRQDYLLQGFRELFMDPCTCGCSIIHPTEEAVKLEQ